MIGILGHTLFSRTQQTESTNSRDQLSPIHSPQATSTFANDISVISFDKKVTLRSEEINQSQRSFLNQTFSPATPSIAVYTITFEFPTQNISSTASSIITAQVFVPETNAQLPTLAYGSGTTGIAPHCAPSLENVKVSNIGNYYNQMVSLASLGYVVIFPNYSGYSQPDETHPYFVADLEAKSLLGSLVALEKLQAQHSQLQTANLNSVFAIGYSQGGHAALATANHSSISKGVSIKGVIGYAPAFDVQSLLKESPRLAPYLVYAYKKHYGTKQSEVNMILSSSLLARFELDMLSDCVDSVSRSYPNSMSTVYTPEFAKALNENSLSEYVPGFSQALLQNQVLTQYKEKLPVLILQGDKDTIVTSLTQQANAEYLCQRSVPVTYKVLPDKNHYQTPSAGIFEVHKWIRSVLAENAPTNCQSVTKLQPSS